jgi:hypothetical protein
VVLHGVLLEKETERPVPGEEILFARKRNWRESVDEDALEALTGDSSTWEFVTQNEDWDEVSAVTDEWGRFSTTEPLPGGEVHYTVFSTEQGSFDWSPKGQSMTDSLTLYARPVGQFAIELTPGIGNSAGTDVWLRAETSKAPRSHGTLYGPRHDGLYVAQFAKEDLRALRDGRQWFLGIASLDGFWWGETRLSLEDERSRIELSARGGVTGDVRDEKGEPVNGPYAALYQLGSMQPEYESWGVEGRFWIRCVQPGQYRLVVKRDGMEPFEERIEVHAGLDSKETIEMHRQAAAGLSIAGSISSDSGRLHESTEVECWNDLGTYRTTKVHWSLREGVWTGTFAIEGLLPGRYHVRVVPERPFEVGGPTPDEALPAGSDELHYVLHDDVSSVRVSFQVADAETELPLAIYEYQIACWRGAWFRTGTLAEGSCAMTDHPSAVPFRWAIHVEGYAPAFGEDDGLPDANGERTIAVRLERGWGARLYVMGPGQEKEPLEGAQVSLDGVAAGTTDAHGTLVLFTEERPNRIGVTYKDWSIDDASDVDPATGALVGGDWDQIVVLLHHP